MSPMACALSIIDSLIHNIDVPTPCQPEPEPPRITELPNEMSHDIDIASPTEILRILRACDSQIFSGWRQYPNIYDFIPILNVIVHHLKDILSDTKHHKVILSGCGTSGRLGWVIARAFNDYLSSIHLTPCFDYCVSGYDPALLTSQELFEDDPVIGVQSPKLDTFSDSMSGQIHRQIVLNPIFGPEPITGSTRMKSGSGTKILLDVMFLIGCYQMVGMNGNSEALSHRECSQMICDLLREFEGVYRSSYSYRHLAEWAKICQFAGNTLNSKGGRVLYVGGADALSIMSFIDASEMKPTFGTPLSRYRSYFDGGWSLLRNKQGDLSHIDDRFKVELTDLDMDSLTEDDLLIFIGNGAVDGHRFSGDLPCRSVHIAVGIDDQKQEEETSKRMAFDAEIVMNIKCETGIRAKFEKQCAGLLAVFDDFRRMFAMKLLLNGISTAGHVLSGNVLQNRMINVRVSNDKLFYRAIGMVQEFGSVDAEVARRCLLQSIYGEDGFQKMESVPVSKHITAARDVDKIVPVAIILAAQVAGGASSKNTTAQIREMLKTESSLRQVIKKFSL